MNKEPVKSNERVALQTFWTAVAISVSLPFPLESFSGTSCMIAATMARGPRRIKMSRRSSVEGNNRVKNWMCVICGQFSYEFGTRNTTTRHPQYESALEIAQSLVTCPHVRTVNASGAGIPCRDSLAL